MRRVLGSAGVVAAVAILPELASACPACASRGGGGAGTLLVLGGMILLPFAIGAIVLAIVRSLDRPDRQKARP